MTKEYPWRENEGADTPKKNLDDLGIGRAVENTRKQIIREETQAEKLPVPYSPNLDGLYYTVFCGVASHFKLSPIETAVLCLVASFHKKGQGFYASKETIAKAVRTSEVTVFTVLKKLKERGLLEQYYHDRKVHLKLGPEAVDRWKHHAKLIETARLQRENLRKPKI